MRREIDYVAAEALTLTETVVKVNRSAKVMKGGRRFSFSALIVLGSHDGIVGLGFGKANEVPPAVEKGVADAKKRLVRIPLVGTTVPHAVMGKFRASSVKIMPAAPGTGVIAGKGARAILEAAGIKDVLTKAYGSTNAVNLVKATLDGLMKLRTRDQVAKMRGVSLR
jgi:small subunit ribosomal protein S5